MTNTIIKKYNIKAKKKLGQNFLVDEKILKEISEIIKITWESIIEVGPWYWALTKKILEKRPKSLDLIELDSDMVNILQDRVKTLDLNIGWVDFSIHNTDVLKFIPAVPAMFK